MDENKEYFLDVGDDDDAVYRLTEEFLLYKTLEDFGIEVGEWHSKLWKNIFEDFIEGMIKNGYVSRTEE